MRTDETHNFAQTMTLMCSQYQQTLSAQMLNSFGQLTQRFGLTYVQQALHTYQQHPYDQQIFPPYAAILDLLVDKKTLKQTQQNNDVSPSSFFYHQPRANLTQHTHINSLKPTSAITFKS